MPPPKSSKDIYSAHARRTSPLDGPRPSAKDHAEWFRKNSGSRWTTAIFVSLILVLVGFMVAVISYQHRQIRAARGRDGRMGAAARGLQIEPREPTPRRAGIDPEGHAVLDEDWEGPDQPPPDGGPYPLTARWIQEAARYLGRAEQAFAAGDWRDAARHYESALTIMPDIEGLSAPIGLSYLRLQEFGPAADAFMEALARGMDSAAIRNNLAVALMAQERYPEAEQELRAAVELDGEYLPARHNLALLYFRTGQLDEAADAFRELLKRETLNPDALHLFAVTLLRLEAWDEAAAVLAENARRYPEAPSIRFRLAEAYAQASNSDAAMDALREAVRLVDARLAMRWISRSEYDPLRPLPAFSGLVEELTAAQP